MLQPRLPPLRLPARSLNRRGALVADSPLSMTLNGFFKSLNKKPKESEDKEREKEREERDARAEGRKRQGSINS